MYMKRMQTGWSLTHADSQGRLASKVQENIVIQDALTFSLRYGLFHNVVSGRKQEVFTSLPAVVFDHMGQLDDKFSLLVFLTALKRMLLGVKKKRRDREGFRTNGFIFQLYCTLSKENEPVCTRFPRCSPHQARGQEGSVGGDKPTEGGAGLPCTCCQVMVKLTGKYDFKFVTEH